MGCMCSAKRLPDDLTPEERLVVTSEGELGLTPIPSAKIAHSAKGLKGVIDINSIAKWLGSFGVDQSKINSLNGQFFVFFQRITESQGSQVTLLQTFGVLIGNGTNEEKGGLFFDIFSTRGQVSGLELKSMLNNIAEVAISLVFVAQHKAKDGMNEYYQKLQLGKEDYISSNMSELVGVNNKDIFCHKVSLMRGLLIPTSIRSAILKFAKTSKGIPELAPQVPPEVVPEPAKEEPAIPEVQSSPDEEAKEEVEAEEEEEEEEEEVEEEAEAEAEAEEEEEEEEIEVSDEVPEPNEGLSIDMTENAEESLVMTEQFDEESMVVAETPQEEVKDILLRCPNGNILTWTNILPTKYFEERSNWMVTCGVCGLPYSRAGWYSAESDFNMCDNCGEEAGVMPPKLTCRNGCVLLYMCDTPQFYGNESYLCQRCGEEQSSPTWHCRKCRFDICSLCASIAGYEVPSTEVLCPKGHELVYEENIVSMYRERGGGHPVCDHSRKRIESGCMHCEECSYDLCDASYAYLSGPVPDHPGFRCPSGHLMHWYQVSQHYKNTDAFICNACGERKNGYCFHCYACQIDMCGDCGYKLSAFLNLPIEVECNKGHPLAWFTKPFAQYHSKAFECNKCKNIFKNIGSLHCQPCKYDVCLRCC